MEPDRRTRERSQLRKDRGHSRGRGGVVRTRTMPVILPPATDSPRLPEPGATLNWLQDADDGLPGLRVTPWSG